jgi:hypothetical protein
MMPATPDEALTADQIRDLEEIAADTSAPSLMRETARRVLSDPARPRKAYADDLRAALKRIDENMPADVTQEDIENDVRQACEEARQERLRQRAEQRTGTL